MTEEQEKTSTVKLTVPDSRVQIVGRDVWLDEESATVTINVAYEDIGEFRKELELVIDRLKELDKEHVSVTLFDEQARFVCITGVSLRGSDAAELVSSIMTLTHDVRMRMEIARMTIPEALAHYQEALAGFEKIRKEGSIDGRIIAVFPTPEQYDLLDSLHRKLTPGHLTDALGPYLAAIAEIQNITNEIQGKEHREVVIKSIAQQSPISVSLDGASQAIQVVTDTVVPWRRKHAEEMARLATLEKQAEIESKKAEVLEKRARAAKDRAEAERLAAEAARQREEAERMKLENEKLRFELYQARIQLALDILAQIAPNLPETEKIAYTIRLLAPLDTIAFSELEIITDE